MFPPVELATPEGVLCQGGHLTSWSLLSAYSQGVFPWPHAGYDLLWFAPPLRGVLFFDELHLNARLRRALRNSGFRVSFNACFPEVMRACAQPRWCEGEWETGTWINDEVLESYIALHRLGFAHSVECWRGEQLVGGLYGVNLGLYFAGESMFHLEDNASKMCVVALVEKMSEAGAFWLDIETLTPHFEKVGACLVPRQQFMELHHAAVHSKTRIF